jgi:hypothetical protein
LINIDKEIAGSMYNNNTRKQQKQQQQQQHVVNKAPDIYQISKQS